MSGSLTAVMPSLCSTFWIYRMPCRICSGVVGGMSRVTGSMAESSLRTPVGLPWASRSMVPAVGSAVAPDVRQFEGKRIGDSILAGGMHEPDGIVGGHG